MRIKLYLGFLSLLSFSYALPGRGYAADLRRGEIIFSRACSSCHGERGEGDGESAVAAGVQKPPRNLRRDPFKFATDDLKLAELIRHGGGRYGLNPLMPPQHGLSDEDIVDLIAFLKTIREAPLPSKP